MTNFKLLSRFSVLFALLILIGCKSETPQTVSLNEQLNRVSDSIDVLMQLYHFNPAELTGPSYKKIQEQVKILADTASTKENFEAGFNKIWSEGPFSHVRLEITERTAAQMANFVDTMRVGPGAVSLEFHDATAILTVNTMMGLDTIERIYQAYQDIAKKGSKSLIIDLRNNGGGAFAIVPLVGHVLDQEVDAGIFVARKWWAGTNVAPVFNDVKDIAPWRGWSVKSFWADVQEEKVLRVSFEAMTPRFQGPVYVLTSSRTASAAEFATDALANAEQVTLVGETTAGEMLSQTMFDLPEGFQLSLPIAEYYSVRMGRIEGKGVAPDVAVEASKAKNVAMALISGEELDKILSELKE